MAMGSQTLLRKPKSVKIKAYPRKQLERDPKWAQPLSDLPISRSHTNRRYCGDPRLRGAHRNGWTISCFLLVSRQV